jgi:hypothetical protein
MTTVRARGLTTRVWARVTPAEIALGAVLVAGAGLRIWLMHAWRPAFLGYPDAIGYIDAARLRAGGLVFWNPYRPAGYPLFLSLMHGLHGGLAFAIAVQHVFGLVIAVLLYLAVARFVRRRWVALLPAIVVAFSGTEIYLEHAALSEALYTLLVVGAIWCGAHSYGIVGARGLLWLAGAGLLIGLSGPVRSTGVLIAPALIGWAAATRPGWAIRLRAAAVVAVAFAVGLGSYLVYQHSVTAAWGLTHTTGETLYARTATFADCRDFTPPAGTRVLCQPPGAARTGATQYMFAPASPAVHRFGLPPDPRNGGSYSWPADHKLEQFAIAAVTHQPWDYVWTTLQGLVKYVDPNWGTPNMLELSHSALIPTLHNLQIEGSATPELAAYYPGHPVVHHSLKALDSYAQAARVEGPFTVVLAVLMLAGFVLARGPRRAGAGLFGWTTVVMVLAPVALLAYGARYATPAYGPLAAGAAIGADEVAALLSGSLSNGRLARLRGRHGRTRAARSPASG